MRVITLNRHDNLRARMLSVFETVRATLIGGQVEIIIQRPSKSREAECKYHAMIGDIARTVEFECEEYDAEGRVVAIERRRYDTEVWKAKLLDEFDREMKRQGTPLSHPGRVVMSLDGKRYITVRPSSAKFRKGESAQFIEFLYATGIELGATFSDPSLRYYEEISERAAA